MRPPILNTDELAANQEGEETVLERHPRLPSLLRSLGAPTPARAVMGPGPNRLLEIELHYEERILIKRLPGGHLSGGSLGCGVQRCLLRFVEEPKLLLAPGSLLGATTCQGQPENPHLNACPAESLTVQRLRALVERLLGVPAAAQRLVLETVEGREDISAHLGRQLAAFSIAPGSR